jgi:hypothetical protein
LEKEELSWARSEVVLTMAEALCMVFVLWPPFEGLE